MADEMETSDDSPCSSQTAITSPATSYDMAIVPSLDNQDVAMRDVFQLTKELYCTKQELERARNDCHRLNRALTSMVGYFTEDGERDSNTPIDFSNTFNRPLDAAQPLIDFDDDDHLAFNNQDGSASWKNETSLLDQSDSDLVSLCHTEPSAAWSSCATCRSSNSSATSSPCLLHGSQNGKGPERLIEIAQDADASTVANLGEEIMDLALHDADKEEGEIIEKNTDVDTAMFLETMPDTFWKHVPDSPHPRNFLDLGIRFDPDPNAVTSYESRKTVLIQNLPAGVALCRVLGHVRGSAVVKCTIVPAAGLAGWDAAYVQFKDPFAAADYADFMHRHPLYLGYTPLVVEHLVSPTYPLPPHLHDAVYRYGATRCLCITGLKMSSSQLHRALLQHFRTPLVIDNVSDRVEGGSRGRQTVIARFASVEAAGKVWWLLKFSRHKGFGTNVGIEYAPDPCDVPLSTLITKVRESEERHYQGTGVRYEMPPIQWEEPLVLDY